MTATWQMIKRFLASISVLIPYSALGIDIDLWHFLHSALSFFFLNLILFHVLSNCLFIRIQNRFQAIHRKHLRVSFTLEGAMLLAPSNNNRYIGCIRCTFIKSLLFYPSKFYIYFNNIIYYIKYLLLDHYLQRLLQPMYNNIYKSPKPLS